MRNPWFWSAWIPVCALFATIEGEPNLEAGFAAIDAEETTAHVEYLASPALEGRDSPSRGLDLAAEYISARFKAAGLAPAPDAQEEWAEWHANEAPPAWSVAPGEEAGGTYLRPYSVDKLGPRPIRRPVPDGCDLVLATEEGGTVTFAYGEDFVPLPGCEGDVRGEVVFAGFGIDSKKEKYSDLKGLRLSGKVAVILEGEPRHKRRFDGPDTTREASLWRKLKALSDEGAVGVLVVRRSPAVEKADREQGVLPEPLGFRYTFASWVGGERDQRWPDMPVALEVNEACASAVLGQDVVKLAAKIDKSARPTKAKVGGREISMRAKTEEGSVNVHNVVGLVRGSDPALADEYVVVGAHYDHIGVDARGRVGFGADDNASGTAALIEMAQATALAGPRRSVLFCAFSAEEDGLVGSRRLCADPPVEPERIVAMLNMDMIGRGPDDTVVLIGIKQNPALEKVVERAKRLQKTGIKKLDICGDPGLFERSDHYSFHEINVPVVFFFEDYPLSKNKDYHTWRDTVDQVDMRKVANTARLAFNTIWILANDDERPPRPL